MEGKSPANLKLKFLKKFSSSLLKYPLEIQLQASWK
jgi:hypothetical protein